jgi:Uma2 family endonuclease
MNILTQPSLAPPVSGRWTAAETQRFVLHDVPWQSYTAIGDALPDRPRLRMTYDRGSLEFMTTSQEHEIFKKRLGRLIETLAEEYNLRIATAGTMTFRRAELERGLEPDDCFWIAHEEQVRARMEWDPKIDPPPDLVVEIEISRSALDRMGIYAALGVPEVWRCDGTVLLAHLLQPNGGWQASEYSPTFPKIPLAGVVSFLQPSETVDYLSMIRAFRAWIRDQVVRSG